MKKQNMIIGGFVLVLLMVTVTFNGSNSEDNLVAIEEAESQSVSSIVSLSEYQHDFGDIGIFDGKVQKTFSIKNEGVEDVMIVSGDTSCGCTAAEIDGELFSMHLNNELHIELKAGEEKIVTAIYDPLAHGPDDLGARNRTITIGTNSTATPELIFRVLANVVK